MKMLVLGLRTKGTALTCLTASVLCVANPVQAISIVTFDDINTSIPPTSGATSVPYNYDGFFWGNNPGSNVLTAINNTIWTSPGNYNNTGNSSPSGNNGVLLNTGIIDVSRSNGQVFNFNGAYFAPFTSGDNLNSQGGTATTVTVQGYNGATLVGSDSITFSAAGYVLLSTNIENITSLRMTGSSPLVQNFQTSWLMDNFTYTDATAVPWETDTLPLIGSTVLFGFALWGKQKLAKSQKERKD
jgi:hypothetical protein